MTYPGFNLTGKVAALTGSSQGMGFAIARAYAQQGAKVIVSSNDEADAKRAAKELRGEGHDAAAVKCDITNRDDVRNFAAACAEHYGAADILVCQAAPPPPMGPLFDIDIDALDALLTRSLTNSLLLVKGFLPEMASRRDGAIVAMSSIAAERANAVLGAYGITKAALNSLLRSIAAEWGGRGIRANGIAPSVVRTPFSQALWSNPETEKAVANKSPAGRIAEVDDIVGAALLFASPAGAYINGQVLLVDGGRSVL